MFSTRPGNASDSNETYDFAFHEEFIPNNIKVDVYTCSWKPVGIRPRATIVFVHGQGEHVSRYDASFREFAKHGFQVHGFDQVGCGKTGVHSHDLGGALGLSRVLLDIDDCIDRAYDSEVPLFIMGQSFGGASTLNYLSMGSRRDLLYGAIATAPCLQVAQETRPYPFVCWVCDRAASILPLFKVSAKLDATFLTRDMKQVEKFRNDPLVFSRCSLIQIRDLLMEGENFMNFRYEQVRVPRLLIVHGTEDKLASYNASVDTFDKLKKAGKISHLEFKTYEGGYHELTNDIIRDEVVSYMIQWLSKQI